MTGGIFDKIGTLADRLRDRVGREFGHCRTCGKPTRSHRVGTGLQCHTCYADGEHVVAADGGLTPEEQIAREIEHNPDASATEVLGELKLSPATWKDTVVDALNADDPSEVLGTGDDPADAGEEPASATGQDTHRIRNESADSSTHRVSCETDSETVAGVDNSDSEPTPGDDERPLDEARAVAGPATADDAGEDAEPLGEADTASVRHTSTAGETGEEHIKTGSQDEQSVPVDPNMGLCLSSWDHDDRDRAVPSGQQFYPDWIQARDWWIDWVLAKPPTDDGQIDADAAATKQPVAPYRNGEARPVQWHFGLDDADHPSTDFETVHRWEGWQIGSEVPAPDRVISDTIGTGIIIPPGQDDGRTLTLLDWDDVRDPETDEIHPVAAAALEACDGYAEISQSGEGIHQFVFGEIPGGFKKFIRHIDTEPFVGDDRPQIEMYQSGRVCAMTGQHVEGTGADVVEGQDLIDELCWRFGTADNTGPGTPTDPYASERDDDQDAGATVDHETPDHATVGSALREAAEFHGETPDDWDVPDEHSLEYHAVLRARERSDELGSVANWELLGYAAALGYRDGLSKADIKADLQQYETPQYGYDESRAEKEIRGVFRKAENGNYAPPTRDRLVERGILPDEYATDPETGDGSGEWYGIQTCAPPQVDRQSYNVDELRDDLQTERYDRFVDHHAPVIWGDDPGVGKTTNAAIAAAERDRPHFIGFPGHEKAREFILDEPTADDYYHLKGTEQKRRDHCMDADHDDEDCPEHGHGSNCPHMCPIHDLPSDHPLREQYDALEAELGPTKAHIIIDDDRLAKHGHDDDGRCPWLKQYDDIEHEDRIVGVHEYQTLKSVRNPSDGPRRDTIIDESDDVFSAASERTLGVDPLVRMANVLERIAHRGSDDPVLDEFARFATDVYELIASDDASAADLEALDPPAVEEHAETVHVEVDPDDPPAWVDPEDIETETVTENVGMPGEGYRTRHRHYVERVLVDETLAQAKIDYHETLLSQIKSDERDWNGAPFAFDPLIAAAIEAGLPDEPARRAVAAPTVLDNCPRCGGHFEDHNGERVCGECDWAESDGFVTSPHDTPAWIDAEIVTNADGQSRALGSREAPLPSELPSSPLILNATPTRRKRPVAAVYDVDPDEILLEGDDDLDIGDGMHVTKVLDGQYHLGTIKKTETLRDRIERAVEKKAQIFDNLLLVGRKELKHILDVPENVDWLHYHALRGKNRAEYDAVTVIGAPHADIDDLERNAKLFTQNRDDIRVGGEEHSTRRDAPNPPVYRKLEYEDADGQGLAVPTKHFTGLVGDMFRQTREQEIEQAVHRLRPLLADDDETKHVFLLTNVPTNLPVDEVCSFEELADPLQALLPIHDRAVTLAEHVRDVTAGDGPDGFRAETLVRSTDDGRAEFHVDELHRLAQLNGMDVTERQVRRWKDDLESIGVLDAGEYKSHEGVPYRADSATLTSALSVLSNNASVEVAVRRRLASLVEESDSALEWLRWARDALGLSGDRCGVDPPPSGGQTPG